MASAEINAPTTEVSPLEKVKILILTAEFQRESMGPELCKVCADLKAEFDAAEPPSVEN